MATNRAVIVTGGGSGMGRATAELFANNGDVVYVLGRRKEALKAVAAGAEGRIIPIQADLAKPQEVDAARKKILVSHKTIDVLVNCAGASGGVSHDLSLKEAVAAWQNVLDNNLTTTFLMIYAFRPHLRRPGGRIINITSTAALIGSSRMGGEAYAAAKSAIHGMSRTLVRQLAPEGITVNCVSPGFIDNTDFFRGKPIHDLRKTFKSQTPTGRVGQPEDIAPAVFYLASEEASFVNGEILNVNGGMVFGR